MPRLSVIIPHYSDLRGLARCLGSLESQTISRDQLEIIVADNDSPLSRESIEATIRDRAKLITVSERGAGPARNGGVAASRGEILAFIDADCVATKHWLEAGLAALAHYDFVGGRVAVSVDDPSRMSGAEAFETVFAFDFRKYILNKGFTGSGNMLVWRRVFDEVGGFRPAVSEDMDWSHRATAMGFSLGYAPEAIVSHPARKNWAELRAKWRRLVREAYLLKKERPAGHLLWVLRTWSIPFSAIIHTPKVLWSSVLPDAPTKLRALATLYRLRVWRFIEGHRQLFQKISH